MMNPFQSELMLEEGRRLTKARAALPILENEAGRLSFVRHIFRDYPNAARIEMHLRDLPLDGSADSVAEALVLWLDGCHLGDGSTALTLLQSVALPLEAKQADLVDVALFRGRMIDGYLVGRRLCGGERAVVYQATPLDGSRPVALQFLLQRAGEPEAPSEICFGLPMHG